MVPPRPALSEVRDYLCGVPFSKWRQAAEAFAASATLGPPQRKSSLRALLYPARFAFSFLTGRMGSNDEALDYLRAHTPAEFDLDLIARALACRRADADPDPLFAERTRLLRNVSACAQLSAQSVLPPLPRRI